MKVFFFTFFYFCFLFPNIDKPLSLNETGISLSSPFEPLKVVLMRVWPFTLF